MKPLDLERFEGATEGPWFDDGYRIYAPTEDENKHNGVMMVEYKHSGHENYVDFELMAAAPQLLAELKALRAWQASVKDAFTQLDDGLHDAQTPHEAADVYREFVENWNTAETELHDGKF